MIKLLPLLAIVAHARSAAPVVSTAAITSSPCAAGVPAPSQNNTPAPRPVSPCETIEWRV